MILQVSKEEDDQGMKSVEITGAPEDVEAARKMIENCLSGSKSCPDLHLILI